MSATVERQSSNYLDPDQFVDFQLQRTRAGIRMADLLTAGAGIALVLASYLLVFVVLDQWVIPGGFSPSARTVMLLELLAFTAYWVHRKIVVPARRRVTELFAARTLEATEPHLRNTLLTLVDLKRADRPVSPEIVAALGKRAARGLSKTDVERAVDRRPLLRMSWALLGVLVLIALYVVFSPKNMSASVWRALLPLADKPVATRTTIDRVDPGNTRVLARTPLTVTVDLAGEMPPSVRLLYTTRDRRFIDEPIEMRPVADAINRYAGTLTGERGQGLLQDLTYRVEAGDAVSGEFSVRVVQAPAATVEEVEYQFATYTGLTSRTDLGGAVDAWEGTEVVIHASANQPVQSATLHWADDEHSHSKAEEFPMQVSGGTQLTGRFPLHFRRDGSAPQFYYVQLRTAEGDTDPRPVLHPLRIRPDLPPRITLHHPPGDVELPINGEVPLAYSARDPDFKLQSVELLFQKDGDPRFRSLPVFEGPPTDNEVRDVYRLKLGWLNLDLKPGDRIAYRLLARDNFEPYGYREPNSSTTETRFITVVDRASREEVEQQLQQQEETAREQLEQAAQQDGESDPDRQDASGQQEPASEGADDESRTGESMEEGMTGEGSSRTTEPASGENGSAEEQATGSGSDSASGPASEGDPESAMSPPDDPGRESTSGSQDASEGTQAKTGSETGDSGSSSRTTSDSADDGTSGSQQRTPQETPSGEDSAPGQNGTDRSQTRQPGESSRESAAGSRSGEGRDGRDRVSDDQLLQELIRRQQERQQNQQAGNEDQSQAAQSRENQDGEQVQDQQRAASGDDAGQQETPQYARPSEETGESGRAAMDTPSETQPRDTQSPSTDGDRAGNGTTDEQGESGTTPMPAEESTGSSPDGQRDTGNTMPPSAEGSSDSGSPMPSPAENVDQRGNSDSSTGREGETPTAGSSDTGDSPESMTRPNESTTEDSSQSQPSGRNQQNPAEQGEGTATGNRQPGDATSSPQRGANNPQASDAASRNAEQPPQGDPAEPGAPMNEEQTARRTDQPNGADDPQPEGEGRRDGQNSENSQTGEGGNSTQTSQGRRGGTEPGAGDTTSRPGQQQTGENGMPGPRQGPGSSTQDGGTQPGDSGQQGSASQTQQRSQSGDASGMSPAEPDGDPALQNGSPDGRSPQQGRGDETPQEGMANQPRGDQSASESAPQGSGNESGSPQQGGPGQQGNMPPGGEGSGEQGTGSAQQGNSGAEGQGQGQSQGDGQGQGQGQADGEGQGQGPSGQSPSSGGGSPAGTVTGGNRGDAPAPGDGAGGSAESEYVAGDESNLEDQRRAANLALRQLQDELRRGEIDEEFKNRLGVTDDDLREFARRLEERLSTTGNDDSPEARDRHRRFIEMLKGIDFSSGGDVRQAGDRPREAAGGFGTIQRPTPAEYRDQERAFKQKLSRQR